MRKKSDVYISFNKDMAIELGFYAAVIHAEIARWCEHNRFHNVEIYNGEAWMYITYKRFQEYLPFFSLSTIRRAIAVLKAKGLIEQTNRRIEDQPNSMRYRALQYHHFEQTSVPTEQRGSVPTEQTSVPTEQIESISNKGLNKAIKKENILSESYDPDVLHFCERFKDKELEQRPSNLYLTTNWVKTKPKWAAAVTRLLKRHHIELTVMWRLHKKVFEDDFWSQQVRSPAKYLARDKDGMYYFDRLYNHFLGEDHHDKVNGKSVQRRQGFQHI